MYSNINFNKCKKIIIYWMVLYSPSEKRCVVPSLIKIGIIVFENILIWRQCIFVVWFSLSNHWPLLISFETIPFPPTQTIIAPTHKASRVRWLNRFHIYINLCLFTIPILNKTFINECISNIPKYCKASTIYRAVT